MLHEREVCKRRQRGGRAAAGRLMLLAVPVLFCADGVLGQTGRIERETVVSVNEHNLTDAILGRHAFTPDDLAVLDINGDGVVDVADLVQYLRQSRPVSTVSFAASASGTDEGRGTAQVQVVFSNRYQGELYYGVAGSARLGEDFGVPSGVVQVDGDAASIPIRILDDSRVEGLETIVLSLLPASGYQLGPTSKHTLMINDNDTTLPFVYFEVREAAANESQPSAEVVLHASRAFSGLLSFEVGGSASEDADFARLGREIRIDQPTETIRITLNEDVEIEGDEEIGLTLKQGFGYAIGQPRDYALIITDDDTRWQGNLLIDESAQLGFVMEFFQGDGGTTSARIVSDGYGTIPAADGGWPIQVVWGPDSFYAEAGSFLLPADQSRTGVAFRRDFAFTAAPAMPSYVFSLDTIRGEYREDLTPEDPSKEHLKRRIEGVFMIMQDRIPPVVQEPTLVQIF